MSNPDIIEAQINWTLDPASFAQSISQLIHQLTRQGKVLPLPIPISMSQDVIPLLLAKIDCSGCDAPCCREPAPNGAGIAIDPLPAARSLAKGIYLNRYQLRRKLQRLNIVTKDRA